MSHAELSGARPSFACTVHKFGGAALRDAEGMQRIAGLLAGEQGPPPVLVVSAMGKTTNALEHLLLLAREGDRTGVAQAFEQLAAAHRAVVDTLALQDGQATGAPEPETLLAELSDILQGVLLLRDFPHRVFDRVMAYGELLSSALLVAYLYRQGLPVAWVDARTLILTDQRWRQAAVCQPQTRTRLRAALLPLLAAGRMPLLQGYIGRSTEGHTTTLGREGSDYSAALVAEALQAERLCVWKDVPGLMTADPRRQADAQRLPYLAYDRAVELSYYGATVLHPKTLRPLHEAGIPLQVRSFLAPESPGTLLSSDAAAGRFAAQSPEPALQPLRPAQALLELQRRDLAFVAGAHELEVLQQAHQLGLVVNVHQASAIRLWLCVDEQTELLTALAAWAAPDYLLHVQPGLVLRAWLAPHPPPADWSAGALLLQQNSLGWLWVGPADSA